MRKLIQQNLLEEYKLSLKDSAPILAKIKATEEMKDQIPQNSTLLEDLEKYREIYVKKR